MSNPWFRMYHEWADDPKVQMMPEHMQRRHVMLFCEQCKGETLLEHQRAFHWRISLEQLAETKALFLQNGFIDDDWNLLNWNKRQFISDSSTDRVRRFRQAKKQSETLRATRVTVGVTAPDTDTDTESDTENTSSSEPKQVRSESPPPKKIAGTLPLNDGSNFEITDEMIREWQGLYPAVDVKQQCRSMKGWILANPARRKTKRGVKSFITGWLSREQDKGGILRPQTGGQFNGNSTSKQSRTVEATSRLIAAIENRGNPGRVGDSEGRGMDGSGPDDLFPRTIEGTVRDGDDRPR